MEANLMPKHVFSNVDPKISLFSINRLEEITTNRVDICEETKFLQISTKRLEKDTRFMPHKHLNIARNSDLTHEAWIVLSGSIEAVFYDLDDSIIETTVLKHGDCAVVYHAGHSFTVLEADTILYEVKNGPYYGREKDKAFINK